MLCTITTKDGEVRVIARSIEGCEARKELQSRAFPHGTVAVDSHSAVLAESHTLQLLFDDARTYEPEESVEEYISSWGESRSCYLQFMRLPLRLCWLLQVSNTVAAMEWKARKEGSSPWRRLYSRRRRAQAGERRYKDEARPCPCCSCTFYLCRQSVHLSPIFHSFVQLL